MASCKPSCYRPGMLVTGPKPLYMSAFMLVDSDLIPLRFSISGQTFGIHSTYCCSHGVYFNTTTTWYARTESAERKMLMGMGKLRRKMRFEFFCSTARYAVRLLRRQTASLGYLNEATETWYVKQKQQRVYLMPLLRRQKTGSRIAIFL